MNKYCSNCGKELKDGADICTNCGALIKSHKKTSKKNWIFILIIVVIIFIGIISILIFGAKKEIENYDVYSIEFEATESLKTAQSEMLIKVFDNQVSNDVCLSIDKIGIDNKRYIGSIRIKNYLEANEQYEIWLSNGQYYLTAIIDDISNQNYTTIKSNKDASITCNK